ncbi:helix-turn-helix domain-containing protein [Chitinophaga nivalis]|uniref:AraC family transcriptional regulator n=1 Tax=Chitinophaga nivalis TaxID=2991709 RepID=A0ABT3IH02_9BACT|nr:AraC family transcriptional regulator [Chitinophaga nivalis]MCW3467064.1 AraC family transcriptional regulator [Chitinophaga nivalis]MCW3483245.1 AraC family transcriptional regulator [Chitinophaga nivalis]
MHNKRKPGHYTSMEDYLHQLNPDNDFRVATERTQQIAVFKREEEHTQCRLITELHRSGYYKISYIAAGSGTFHTADHHFDIAPGMIVVTKPAAALRWELTDAVQTGFYVLFAADFYDVGLLPLYRIANALQTTTGCWYYQTTPDTRDLLSDLFQQLHRHRHQPAFARHYLRLLVAAINQLNDNQAHTYQTRSEATIKDFQLLIDTRLSHISDMDHADLFSVKTYAHALKLDDNYLNTLCKAITGKSAGAIIKEKVAAEARLLLSGTTLSISEIAYRLCFYDAAHFSHWFRKIQQQSPTAYRAAFMYK